MRALDWKRLTAFAFPAAPLMALTLPATVFLPPFYTEVVGLSAGVVGVIFMMARMFDILVDPMIGAMQDRYSRPLGMSRRRGWLVIFAVLLVPMVWTVFHAAPGTPVWLATLTIMAMFTLFAGCMIAHLGWASEIEPDYDKRAKNLGVMQMLSVAGMLLVITAPVVTGQTAPDERVHLMGLLLTIALPVTVLLAALFAPEPEAPPEPHVGLRESLRVMRANRPFRTSLIIDFASGFGPGVTGALFLWYFSVVLGMGNYSTLLLVVYFATGVLGMPVWIWLATRIGKNRALTVGALYGSACLLLVPFIPPGNVLLGAIGMAVAGLSYGAPVFLVRAIMADVTDLDELETGKRRAGLFFGLMLTTSKIGLALAVGVTYPLLDWAGFDARLGADNPENAKLMLAWLFIAVPVAFNLLMAWQAWKFPITAEIQRDVRRRIAERAAMASSG